MHQVVWRVKNFILISIPDPYEALAEDKDIGACFFIVLVN